MTRDVFDELFHVVETKISVNTLYANRCIDKLRPSLIWIGEFINVSSPKSCDILLRGCYGAGVEAVSLVSFGLIRPAVLSLRSFYELNLQYLYYRDHPVEWRSVVEYRSRPKLPGEIKKYLKDYFPKFEDRFETLLKEKTRSNDDCYQALSGVAHGTAINSISSASQPKDIVEIEEVVSQSVNIFADVGEQVCDIYVSCFDGNWFSLPDEIRNGLKIRFDGKQPRRELDL